MAALLWFCDFSSYPLTGPQLTVSFIPDTPPTGTPNSLRAVVLVSIIGIAAMAVLGWVIIKQFRDAQLRDAREIGSAYIQGILAPYAMEAVRDGRLSDQSITDLGSSVARAPTMRQFTARQIYSTTGDRWFNSNPDNVEADHNETNLEQALQGKTVASIEYPDPAATASTRTTAPFIEIYAPIFRPGSEDLIAVGEVYMAADLLLSDRKRFESVVYAAVGLATLGFLMGMLMVARQQSALIHALHKESAAARLNAELRQSAESAWRATSESNEALLNQLGAELHDGPIQMLSLLALVSSRTDTAASPVPLSAQTIAHDVLADLRRIAIGLILPELGGLGTRETVALAVQRHQGATGTDVALDIGSLPSQVDHQRKTCIYRIVQEGLNNAFRHGGGLGQSVTAKVENTVLRVTVRNSHGGGAGASGTPLTGLGLQGLRNRLRVHDGALDHRIDENGQFILTATLPLT